MSGNQIYYIGGAKGGVGKSTMSAYIINKILRNSSDNVFVYDTDSSNPDIFKIYGYVVGGDGKHIHNLPALAGRVETLDLDSDDGWMTLINNLDQAQGATFVVNSAARSMEGLRTFGGSFRQAVHETGTRTCLIWPISPQQDSINLLKEAQDTFQMPISVGLNLFLGRKQQFVPFLESSLFNDIEGAGGSAFLYHELANRLKYKIIENRWGFDQAREKLPLGERIELDRWLSLMDDATNNIVPK